MDEAESFQEAHQDKSRLHFESKFCDLKGGWPGELLTQAKGAQQSIRLDLKSTSKAKHT